MQSSGSESLTLWHFKDGKPGHDNQTLGLIQALADLKSLSVHSIDLPTRAALADLLGRRFPAASGLPDPDLILGAGHATHLPMLGARRARGGQIVALMKPSLPLAWFDLCLVPEHDGIAAAFNVLLTRGVLTRIRPCGAHAVDVGLILIGGPSTHHDWSVPLLIAQLKKIVGREREVEWTVTTSRRTPEETTRELAALACGNLKVVPFDSAVSDWVPQQLARAGRVWVSEDSVSMVYEALTSGAGTGSLRVPERQSSRVSRGLATLVKDGLVTPFERWEAGEILRPPATPFDEAARCATWILNEWPSGR